MIFLLVFDRLVDLSRAHDESPLRVAAARVALNTSPKQFTQGFYHWQRKAWLT